MNDPRRRLFGGADGVGFAEIRLRDGVPARPWFVVQSAIGPVPCVVTAFVEFAVLATKNGATFDQAGVNDAPLTDDIGRSL